MATDLGEGKLNLNLLNSHPAHAEGLVKTYIYKLATLVESDLKAPFSIATTPRCRGGHYSFPGLLHFTHDVYLIMLSVKQGGIKYHFLSLWYDST